MPIETSAIRRLEAMDIQVWCARTPKRAEAADSRYAPATSGEDMPVERLPAEGRTRETRSRPGRIRLEAGSGRWLLVVDDADRARHAALIEDIRAALGTGDCRFGTWSDSAEAGVAVEDWNAHGIRHALVFGGETRSGFVQAGELDALAASGDERRALWRQLQPLLLALED